MSTIASEIGTLTRHAESMKSDAAAAVGTMSIGDVVRQGDIYLTRIGKRPAKLKPIASRQLAPGTTQGSRHVVVGDCEIFEAKDKDAVAALIRRANGAEVAPALIGPVIVASGEITIEHPEHGHRTLPADGVCVVTYQRAFAEEIRRVQD